ncbi:hypothetical protein [Bacillus sp. PK3_68]|uniref:hypothetical protein n=1 Tax=Bacillus sp. PK3_68 TaxID=2027408 RepID=UPI000E706F4D|nr:hypothetical protein [Bacillus sp. PK3_68]RJS60103.1 hypothetical protein CJ483_08540 [Bacillus sp. PK3_68]
MTKARMHLNLPNLDKVTFVESRYLLPAIGQSNTIYVVKEDETNGRMPTLYYFNGNEYIMLNSGSGGGGMQSYQQLTKLGVTANPSMPRTYNIPIEYTTTFLRAPVEILKFTAGVQDIVKTEISFDNADASDFTTSDYIRFDGAMSLKTNYTETMTQEASWTDTGSLLRKSINLDHFKKINTIGVG